MRSDPYCGECGYSLKGLTDSTKCPECGKPIIEVLERDSSFKGGRRYQSKTILFGLPLLSIALGPSGKEKRGRAKGIIAVGDIATGWLALGGFARGIIAFGGMSLGVLSFGGLSMGLIAFGGWAIGGVATGGGAVGVVAQGGGAVGYVASGGGAAGVYARGGGVKGRHVLGPVTRDPEAVALFSRIDGWLGVPQGGVAGPRGMMHLFILIVIWIVVAAVAIGAIPAAMVAIAYSRRPRAGPSDTR